MQSRTVPAAQLSFPRLRRRACLPSAAPKSAQADSLDAVVKQVQLSQKKTTSLQADFRQEKALALLSKPEVSTGTFLFSKPNNVLRG